MLHHLAWHVEAFPSPDRVVLPEVDLPRKICKQTSFPGIKRLLVVGYPTFQWALHKNPAGHNQSPFIVGLRVLLWEFLKHCFRRLKLDA